PEHLLLARIVLLGQQAKTVAKPEKPLEQAPCIFLAPDQKKGVRQPEGAGEECPLSRWQAIVGPMSIVAQDQPIEGQLALDSFDRPPDARIVRREEADGRQQQQAR